MAFFTADASRLADGAPAGYVNSRECAECHAALYQTFSQTGMGRSFYVPTLENVVEDYQQKNSYYHAASDTHFQMIERNGRFYQRRFHIGFDRKETNVDEKQIDYVMGSGNHVRSYLHRTIQGTLQELPLAWYSENGGHWGMNPGYDNPDQRNSLRTVSYDCMFCHNAYPTLPAGYDQYGSEAVFGDILPQGIDCQRCHGPGGKHVEAARSPHPSFEAIRGAIVNPATLLPERQMEVCMQCHLETTSGSPAYAVRKFDEGPFDYRPGEPLSDFELSFDHAPTDKQDRFQIAGAVYRLRMSQCFIKSSGRLTCTTCHDPHNIPHDASADQHYNAVCGSCHQEALREKIAQGRHTRAMDCVQCHMPKRRTQDVVQVVMTDHYIQRNQKAGDLLAPIPEARSPENDYKGPMVPYYPARLGHTPENDLYLDVAQVRESNNLEAVTTRFASDIARYKPQQVGFYLELGDAWSKLHQPAKAIPLYEEALQRNAATFVAVMLGLGAAHEQSGDYPAAESAFKRCISSYPETVRCWEGLANEYARRAKESGAIEALQTSLRTDPESPDAWLLLGQIQLQGTGDRVSAEASFREAIRLKPNFPQAHVSLADLLLQTKRLDEAEYEFRYALHLNPGDAVAHFDYGEMLRSVGRLSEAADQMQTTLRIDSSRFQAYEVLGQIDQMRGDLQGAISNYSELVRDHPERLQGQFELGSVLALAGRRDEAIMHLQLAMSSSNAELHKRAADALSQISK